MRRPNLLFVLADQHRPDFLGINPELPVRTPHIDTLAHEGMHFVNAVTPSPLCAPARACLASGRRYEACGVRDNDDDYPTRQPTYYGVLRERGYHVAGVGKFDLHKASLDWGLRGDRLLSEWGFSEGIDNEGKMDAVRSGALAPKGPYMAYLHQRGLAECHVRDFQNRYPYRDTHPTPLPDDAYCDNWIADNGLRLLRRAPSDRPWHLVVNFTGPHDPMDVTAGMQRRWDGVAFPPPHRGTQLDAATHQRIRRNYAAMIENIDRHVGRFLHLVRARGELEHTLVVYSSDHGEMLGDHDLWGKSSWRRASVSIPLVVKGPAVRSGSTSDALVSLHDLAATFLDYADVQPPIEMDSRSLRPVLDGRSGAARDVVRSSLRNWRMVRDRRFKLVDIQGSAPLLFDLTADPDEDNDIAPSATREVARLQAVLDATP